MTKKKNSAMPESPSSGGVGEAINHTQAHARYCATCNELLQLFCAKHGYTAEPDCWVGGDVGGIAAIGDYYVDMRTIIVDLREEAPEEEFIRWYDYCLEADELHITSPNYRSWLHGCPRVPEERLQRLRDLRAQLFEETERIKREF